MRWFALVLSGLLFTNVFAADEENWPQFLGPTGDGHAAASAKGLPTSWSESDRIKWKTPIRGRGWCSPVIWGQQIWMTSATPDGHELFVICLDRDSGQIVHDFKLFDVEKPSEIHALNSYASPSPVIEKGRVYVTWGSYGTAALDTKTAEVLWTRRDLPCEHFRGPGSSPILYGNLLILHYDGFDFQYVVAMDKLTGQNVWKVDRNINYGTTNGDFKKAFSTPAVFQIDGKPQLISPTSKATISYDPLTGKEFWRVTYPEFSATVKPLYGEGLVFINTGFGKANLIAVDPHGEGDLTTKNIVWKQNKSIPSKPSQLLIDGLLYLVHDQGTVSCLDAKTGDIVWQQRMSGNFSASPIYADGKIYLLSQEGIATVIAPGRTYKELAQNKLDDGFMASPAAVGTALYLRTRSAMYRIEN